MKILIDMNLSPDWVPVLKAAGFDSVHWSRIGNPKAADSVIMDVARTEGYIVFTHDLDFGSALALTNASGPSVIQVRSQKILPSDLSSMVISVLTKHQPQLEAGALIVVDETRARVRILPLSTR